MISSYFLQKENPFQCLGEKYSSGMTQLLVREVMVIFQPVANFLWFEHKVERTMVGLRPYSEIYQMFRKTLEPSCSGPKVVPAHKIWVHRHILEWSNRIQRIEIIKWEKFPSKWFFSYHRNQRSREQWTAKFHLN